MVQPPASPEKGKAKEHVLTQADLLWPFAAVRDAILRPDSDRQIPKHVVGLLVRFYLKRLKAPWEPFPPASPDDRRALAQPTVTIPGTDIKFDVTKGSRSIALRLSDETGISEISALLMFQSYLAHAIAIEDAPPAHGQTEEDALIDRLLLWFELELLAVPQIVMALYVPSQEPTGTKALADELSAEILGDQAVYIEGLFRAFSTLAQKPVDPAKTSKASLALYWTTLQLRQQETLLDLLFLILYKLVTRPAAVSEGLIKGAVLSGFGCTQANREIWDADPECQRLQYRIRDLLVIIAIEAMCLAQIVSPESSEDTSDVYGATLLHSRDRLHAVHTFLMEQSDDLDPHHPEQQMVFPQWPMPVLCLVWAIVLRSLPANLQPPTGEDFQLDTNAMTNDDPMVYLGAAQRALRMSSGLFPWLETMLSGPLFEDGKDAFSGDLATDMAALRRSPLKDALIGLSEMVQLEYIPDRSGLYRVWELLYGGGSREASCSLASNYWSIDFAYDDRRAILDESHFPRQATHLPRLLAALTGVSSDDDTDYSIPSADTAAEVYDYVSNLPKLTITVPPATFVATGNDDTGRVTVEAGVDFVLPGGITIPKRTQGRILSGDDDEVVVVEWRFRQSAWPLIVEILRAITGTPPVKTPRVSGTRQLSVVDLGIQGEQPFILASGIKLLRAVLRAQDVPSQFVNQCNNGLYRYPGQSTLELALDVVTNRSLADAGPAKHAIDILQSLLLTGENEIWGSFRASGFFDSHSRSQGSIVRLIQGEAQRGEHGLTVALLRLVRSLAMASLGDPIVVRSAVKLIFTVVWGQFSGWRFRDLGKRYEIAATLIHIFDTVLRHPLGADGTSASPAAQYLIDAFVANASPLTYKPLVDILTQAIPLATKLIQSRRWSDAEVVMRAFDQTASLLATLLRLAPSLGVGVTALPYSILASTVVQPNGDKIQLVDSLFDVISQPTLQTTSLRLILRLLRVYLETTSGEGHRPSLAGMLRCASDSCTQLADVAFTSSYNDVKPDAWALLGTIISTQPGCAHFCIGTPKKDKVAGPVQMAVDEVQQWKTLFDMGPRALAAVIGYLQAVFRSPSATQSVAVLRNNGEFWKAVHDVALKFVALPSDFSPDIATDVRDYAYAVQAKANATSLLAVELAHVLDLEGQPETKAQSLVMSLFRNAGALQDAAIRVVRTSCDPELHAGEAAALRDNNVNPARMRTICLPTERDYGLQYLYDAQPAFFNEPERQTAVDRSLAYLNLNWSQLDADIALTKSFRLLSEIANTWTEGDALSAKAATRAAESVAEELAKEDRGGDVMLAIQTERLSILATLLETALGDEAQPTMDAATVKEIANSVRKIVESQLFPPIISLRHPELPAIHRPVLRILLLLSQADGAERGTDDVLEVLFDCGATFALDAATLVLEALVREPSFAAEQDLGLVVALLCEMSRVSTSMSVWLDKLAQVNLIQRSLSVLVRATRTEDGNVPAHFQTILLLHLAIASNAPSAEKLAVSGVLPAYADNVVAVAAEQAAIDAAAPNASLHRAWLGMLMVVKALLASLPDAATFARSDVLPWLRVVLPQLVHGAEWAGEQEKPLSKPALKELELVSDVLYGLAATTAGLHALLDDFAPSILTLLAGVRYALSHPHAFCALLQPSSESEKAILEDELATVDAQKEDVNLVDRAALPLITGRTEALLRATRTALVSLVGFTRAWDILNGDVDPQVEYLLPYDDEHVLSASSDPVGIINDLYGLLMGVARKLPAGAEGADVPLQAAEAAALLSLTQLLQRRALRPAPDDAPDTDAMDVDAHGGGRAAAPRHPVGAHAHAHARSGSSSAGSAKRRGAPLGTPRRDVQVRRELEADVCSMLPGGSEADGGAVGGAGAVGTGGLLGALRQVADRAFAE